MNQIPLFPPRARTTDPASSYAAAEEMVSSGRMSMHQEIVLSAVRMNPGSTSKELADTCELDRYQIARRLPDLESMGEVFKGPIRTCKVGNRPSVTWSPASMWNGKRYKCPRCDHEADAALADGHRLSCGACHPHPVLMCEI